MRKPKATQGPQFIKYFGPLLDTLRELGGSGTPDEVVERIAKNLNISDEFQNELLPSGQPRFKNQVAWGRLFLASEGLLDSSKRGVWSLTQQGQNTTLNQEEARNLYLRVSEKNRVKKRNKSEDLESTSRDTLEASVNEAEAPLVEIPDAVAKNYRQETIEILRKISPSGFERLSQRLLREAGFTQVVVTGKSGDGGIDGYGTLQINHFVSMKVLFQCKRYANSVSPFHVRDFRGAMAGVSDKGIFITTGTFTTEARREATKAGVPPIELIDGEKLVEMLETFQLGLKQVTTFVIDEEFFSEFYK